MALALLSALQIKHAKPGILYDGGGIQIRVDDTNVRAVLRYTSPGGERRELGLGAVDRTSTQSAGRSLAEARRRAQEARSLLDRGLDPIEERKSQRSAAKEAGAARKSESLRGQLTLARVARDYHERVIEPTRTPKHSAQWIASLESNLPQHIWHSPIAKVTAPLLLDAIAEVSQRVPETASRIRQRLEAVFDDAEFRTIRVGNPARAVRRKLTEMRQGRRARTHFAALHFEKVPELVARIRTSPGIAARALEFGVLTASRTAEILGAEWEEFDLDAGIWTVPRERMKAREVHTVFLSPRAIEILEGQRSLSERYPFPSPVDRGKPLSNMGMLSLLRRLQVDARQRFTASAAVASAPGRTRTLLRGRK